MAKLADVLAYKADSWILEEISLKGKHTTVHIWENSPDEEEIRELAEEKDGVQTYRLLCKFENKVVKDFILRPQGTDTIEKVAQNTLQSALRTISETTHAMSLAHVNILKASTELIVKCGQMMDEYQGLCGKVLTENKESQANMLEMLKEMLENQHNAEVALIEKQYELEKLSNEHSIPRMLLEMLLSEPEKFKSLAGTIIEIGFEGYSRAAKLLKP